MTEINKYPADVFNAFEKAAPKFLVCVIIKNNQGQYQFQSFHVASIEELYFQIAPEALVRFKVFTVGGQFPKVEGALKGEAKEHQKAEEMKKELALYKKLKAKFELIEIPEIQ